jgi:hypothetical protein
MRATRPDGTHRLQKELLDDLVGRMPRSEAGREAVFRKPRRGTVADRWHVYAHGYAARLIEALELEYAAVARILGPEAFAALVGRYTAVFPPRSFDLANAGDRLARFLDFDAVTLELPFLPDLARLERAVAVCFTAENAAPIRWSDLSQRAPEDVAILRLRLAPGVALADSAWPLADLWRARLQEDDAAVSIRLEGRPSRALVFRRDGRVVVEEISTVEAALVESAGPGDLTLADLKELSGTPDEPESVAALLEAFRRLTERGVFVHKRSTGWTGALEIPKEEP